MEVSHTLGFLTAAKHGLSDSEMIDILSCDEAVLEKVFVHYIPPGTFMLMSLASFLILTNIFSPTCCLYPQEAVFMLRYSFLSSSSPYLVISVVQLFLTLLISSY